ncbi:hypothetical protein C8R42DRAFT_726183 [Lentinula raphanica]|nr:hypothetical protein C8R42DRAFT_726183 [Lentinula raphanica]
MPRNQPTAQSHRHIIVSIVNHSDSAKPPAAGKQTAQSHRARRWRGLIRKRQSLFLGASFNAFGLYITHHLLVDANEHDGFELSACSSRWLYAVTKVSSIRSWLCAGAAVIVKCSTLR